MNFLPMNKKAQNSFRAVPRTNTYYSRYTSFHLKTTLIVFGSILGFILLVLLLLAFSRAKITYVAHEEFISLDVDLVAYTDVLDGPFVFDTIALEDEVSQPLTAIESERVESFTTGKIELQNSSASPVQLLPYTRVNSEGGLLYFIQSGVPVIVPPQLEGQDPLIVDVQAEFPGSSYNLNQGTFKIPGLEGEPEYMDLQGILRTPFEGGGIENMPVIPEGLRDELITKMRQDLEEKLRNRITLEKTERFMAYSTLMTFTEHEPIIDQKNETEISVILRGSVMAILIEKERFAEYVVTEILKKDVNSTVALLNPEDIIFSAGALSLEGLANARSLPLSIQGEAHIRYELDHEEFKIFIAGLPKKAVYEIADKKIEIETIDVSLRPFFRFTLQVWKKNHYQPK